MTRPSCLCCRVELSDGDAKAHLLACVFEGVSPNVVGAVCPLCTFKGRDADDDHIHLMVDGALN